MSAPLVLALPSKGRLHEQIDNWLSEADLTLKRLDGGRGYTAVLEGISGVEVRLLAPREIAQGLDSGELHVGITGEDLLQEVSRSPSERLFILQRLAFGGADVVVAAPRSWLDVSTIADLEEVAAQERARRGRPMKVATKYPKLTRRFFAAHGLTAYRLVASHGATEGAPASGAADLIVDITSTGATLEANHLKPLSDGVILKSEAVLSCGVTASWTPEVLETLAQLLGRIEARARARDLMEVRLLGAVNEDARSAAQDAAQAFDAEKAGASESWMCARAKASALASALCAATDCDVALQPVSAVFTATSAAFERFRTRLSRSI